MKKLIINADDFGLSHHATKAIIEAFENGLITSASLVVNGADSETAIAYAKTNNFCDVGIHLSLNETRPAGVCEEVAFLTDENGFFFRRWHTTVVRIASNIRKAVRAIHNEWRAQIEALLDSGISLSHINSHQHLHLLPPLFDVACELAQQFRIRWIRIPYEPLFIAARRLPFSIKSIVRWAATELLAKRARIAVRRELKTPDCFLGLLESGRFSYDAFVTAVNRIPDGITELMVHPSERNNPTTGYFGADELAALRAVKRSGVLKELGIDLTSFAKEAE